MQQYNFPLGLDDYRPLGASGLLVSPLALGAMTFGESWGFGCDKETSYSILDRYFEEGGNFIDTANLYTRGESESILGEYFRERGARARDRAVVATKFGSSMSPQNPNAGGSGRKAIVASCEASLQRLKVDSIDLYWIHFWDKLTPIEEVLETLDFLVRQGKVRYVGFSDHPSWICAKAMELCFSRNWTRPIALQIEYNMLERTVEGELIPMANHFGLGVVPWSPLRGGLLTGKYMRDYRPESGTVRKREEEKDFNENTWSLIDLLKKVASKHQATVAQVAISWLLKKNVVSPIIGARSVAQLEENVKSLKVEIDKESTLKIDEMTHPRLPFPCEFLHWIENYMRGGMTVCGNKSVRPEYLFNESK